MNHMAIVNESESNTGKIPYYLPHHAVLRPSSSTTKLRVVFDASAKTRNGNSLNDLLLIGPRLQQDLTSIVLLWRLHKIVFTADIAKMYRQILVDKKDQHLQRIIWRDMPNKPIRSCELKTITYGTASAPYLAIQTLKQLALDEKSNFSKASEIVLRDFYVDEPMSGTNSVPEALSIQQEIRQLLQKGGFPIRKWTSNCSEVILNIPEEDREISPLLEINADDTVKALDIHWNPNTDDFRYKVKLQSKPTNTKRQMVLEIAKLFDPLGCLAPEVVTSKILYQKLWLIGLEWDDQMP